MILKSKIATRIFFIAANLKKSIINKKEIIKLTQSHCGVKSGESFDNSFQVV